MSGNNLFKEIALIVNAKTFFEEYQAKRKSMQIPLFIRSKSLDAKVSLNTELFNTRNELQTLAQKLEIQETKIELSVTEEI